MSHLQIVWLWYNVSVMACPYSISAPLENFPRTPIPFAPKYVWVWGGYVTYYFITYTASDYTYYMILLRIILVIPRKDEKSFLLSCDLANKQLTRGLNISMTLLLSLFPIYIFLIFKAPSFLNLIPKGFERKFNIRKYK